MNRAQQLIDELELVAHPEGGYFKETHRSNGKIPLKALCNKFNGDRNYIYKYLFFVDFR